MSRALVLVVGLVLAGTASAQPHESDPVQAGATALRSSGSYPWYDDERDQIRAVEVQSSVGDAAHRSSSWESTPGSWDWPDWDLAALAPIARFLVFTVIALVVVAIIALLVRLLKHVELPTSDAAEFDEEVARRGDIDRIEALPFPVLRQRGDLLEAARQAYQAGRFDEAIVYLFSYFLIRLDRAQLLRLARGKTNRQYLNEVGWRTPAGSILSPTIVAFEDVYFGHHPLDRSRFEACWNRLDEFHSLVQESDQ